jgi:hypothetical protein
VKSVNNNRLSSSYGELVLYAKCLEKFLAHTKFSINVSSSICYFCYDYW